MKNTVRVNINDNHDVFCGRPSVYGNQYSHKENTTAKFKTKTKKESLEKFSKDFYTNKEFQNLCIQNLLGKKLACYCKTSESCHVDIIVEFLNNSETSIF